VIALVGTALGSTDGIVEGVDVCNGEGKELGFAVGGNDSVGIIVGDLEG